MKQKPKHKKSYPLLKIVVVALVLIGAAGTTAWIKIHTTKANQVYSVTGKIIGKKSSCHKEELLSDGTTRRGPDICDSGNYLIVGNKYIMIGGGSITAFKENTPDMDSIRVGDMVKVTYIIDSTGEASTNCESCIVKKIKQ